ncbi:MAG: GDP-mannose 4,6-dehydratase [Bryobacteraceae bacterium]|jgi:GDPmannose 4,6-dehydratase
MARNVTTSALVLGVNGQDGSYIADVLIERGDRVTGVGRQAASRWVDPAHFHYVQLDAADAATLDGLLSRVMPDQIYHMAAVHGSAGHAYEEVWRQALALNVGSVHTCLEHMRLRSPSTRLFYPSSVKVFGNPPPAEIDEATPRVGSCLYSITKNAATELIHYYRAHHDCWACVGYYFNHDSPRRPDNYFLPRLTAQIAASLQRAVAPGVATLDFWCDWGSSREFMELTVDLLGLDVPHDVVMATGRPVYAADLARVLAESVGAELPPLPHRTVNTPPVRARLEGLQSAIGRVPRNGALDVASWILADRQGLRPRMLDKVAGRL